jgi:uncharacterized UPF0160 family protein
MNLFRKKITVVTHSGDFHADDVFACATLLLWADKNGCKLEIIRNRDREIIEKADIVVDVGMEYNPDKNRFDHHQKGGAGTRDNKVPYASFGLVWNKYGEDICGNLEIVNKIENNLAMPIDARDNGINISLTNELGIVDHRTSDMICEFNLTWQEDEKLLPIQFKAALHFAKEILKREIAWARALIDGEKETAEAIREQNEPEILILDKNTEWHEAVSKIKNIKFVVYKHENCKDWYVQVGMNNPEDYSSKRIKFPENWRGLEGEDLVGVSGVKGALFCTSGGWLAVAKTKEGAIEIANKALHNLQN